MALKAKVARTLSLITENNGVYEIPAGHIEMIFENDPQIMKIKEKCNNITALMNDCTGEELDKFMQKDFETEIWKMI